MTPIDHGSSVPQEGSEHHVDYWRALDTDYSFKCSCGAKWTVGREKSLEQATESIRSHLISAGLKPSEVL